MYLVRVRWCLKGPSDVRWETEIAARTPEEAFLSARQSLREEQERAMEKRHPPAGKTGA